MDYIVFAVQILLVMLAYWILGLPEKKAIKRGETPMSIVMATHHENAKFRIRYRNLDCTQDLYKIGLRDGQFGAVVKHRSGMYAKTTVDGRCRFVPISSYNYTPT